MKPLVSIIIPVFNREKLIAETLDSVCAQLYQNWECIVVDDGSTDSTVEVVNIYSIKDKRIRVFVRPDSYRKGASSSRNFGLQMAEGELIQFLDSDDLLENNKFQEQVKLYKGDLTLFTCKWGGFENTSDLKKRFKYKYHSYKDFHKGINLLRTFGSQNEFFPQHVYLVPKPLIEKTGLWNEALSNNDDAEFFTRVILQSTYIKFASQTSVYYRYSGLDKLSSFTDEQKVISAINSWKLIHQHIKKEYPKEAPIYVENAKIFLKNTLKRTYPEILKVERQFFKSNSSVKLLSCVKNKLSNFFGLIT